MAESRSYAERVAANLLKRHGFAAIWQLQMSAARAYREGNPAAAASIAEIADAAEREWMRLKATDRA
jgi:hypothetical protein